MASSDILTLSPEFGIEESITFNTNITEAESGKEHRDALWDSGLREYKVTCKFLTKADMDTIWDFYIDRKGAYDHFLIKILTEYEKDGENVGSADTVTTQFQLDNYPIDTNAGYSSCTVSGVSTDLFYLNNHFPTEKSYIIFTTPPASGTILVTYDYYFKVRFKEDTLNRQLMAYQLLNIGVTLKEDRWTTYVPINGNA